MNSNSSSTSRETYQNGTLRKPIGSVQNDVTKKLESSQGNNNKSPSSYYNLSRTNSSNSNPASNCTLKPQRPISVVIGEYPSRSVRKQPGKLDFLQNGHDSSSQGTPNQSISSQLASELAQTLNRFNLKKRTESVVSGSSSLVNYTKQFV